MRETFRSLRNRNYRYFAIGSAIANVGTWLQRVAQDWLVLDLTGNSGVALGITTGLQFLPFLLLAPYGGVIADRFPKRKVLQCTQIGMGVAAAALALLSLTGVVQVWHVYVLTFLFGVASAIDNPARQAFVLEMVGRDDLPNAVALNSASFNGARVLGPAIAGFLIVAVGTGWVIMLNALSYAATVFALAKMRESELHSSDPVPRKPGMIADGLAYVRSRPDLVLILATVFFVGCFGLNFQMTSALMATEVFGKGAAEYGILGTVMAVGAVVGALVAARRGSPRMRLVLGSALAFAVLEIASGLMPTYSTFAASLPLLGFIQLTMITAANAAMQLTVSPEMRGRVLALYAMVFIGSKPLGSPILGWVGEQFGARWTLIGGGLASLVGPAVAALVILRWQRLRVTVRFRPRLSVEVQRRDAQHGVPHPAEATTAEATTAEAATAETSTTEIATTEISTAEITATEAATVEAATAEITTTEIPSNDEADAADSPPTVRRPAPQPEGPTPAAAGSASETSAGHGRVPPWNQRATSPPSRPARRDSSSARRTDTPHRSRPVQTGRSTTRPT